MRFKLAFLGCLAFAPFAAAQSATQSPTPPQQAPRPSAPAAPVRAPHLGQWLTEDGKSRVDVSDCGTAICAKIIWLREPNDEKGQPLRDGYNKSTQLRTRPILGLSLFETMKPSGNGWEGRIYNPEEGEWYDVNVWLAGDKLTIKGCVLFVCETHAWTRVPVTAGVSTQQGTPAGGSSSAPSTSPRRSP